jgi:hypothetical protein
MNKKILTLGTIRDYIIEYFPDLLWWDGFHKHEPFNSSRSYKHRQGMPNEVRIEFDGDDIEENWQNVNLTAVELNNKGYSFAIYSVDGGRSPHIHIYDLDELEHLDEEQRKNYRRKFLSRVCPKNSNPDYELCDEKHLCALEFVNHFKYNKPKELLNYFWNGRNTGIEFDIKCEVLEQEPPKKKKEDNGKNQRLKFGDMLRQKSRDIIIENLSFERVFDKYGVKYKGKMAQCPFHNDTNNSLSFSNDNGLWKCFGCNSKGDIITIIKLLREKYGDQERS